MLVDFLALLYIAMYNFFKNAEKTEGDTEDTHKCYVRGGEKGDRGATWCVTQQRRDCGTQELEAGHVQTTSKAQAF